MRMTDSSKPQWREEDQGKTIIVISSISESPESKLVVATRPWSSSRRGGGSTTRSSTATRRRRGEELKWTPSLIRPLESSWVQAVNDETGSDDDDETFDGTYYYYSDEESDDQEESCEGVTEDEDSSDDDEEDDSENEDDDDEDSDEERRSDTESDEGSFDETGTCSVGGSELDLAITSSVSFLSETHSILLQSIDQKMKNFSLKDDCDLQSLDEFDSEQENQTTMVVHSSFKIEAIERQPCISSKTMNTSDLCSENKSTTSMTKDYQIICASTESTGFSLDPSSISSSHPPAPAEAVMNTRQQPSTKVLSSALSKAEKKNFTQIGKFTKKFRGNRTQLQRMAVKTVAQAYKATHSKFHDLTKPPKTPDSSLFDIQFFSRSSNTRYQTAKKS